VDGHNRYGICLKHKLNFKIHLIPFDSLKEVRDYMIDNQLGRRNLIPEQASYLRGLRYNSEKLVKGKYDRQTHKGQNVPYAIADLEENNDESHKGQNVPYGSITKKESTSARLSKQYNVSEKTIKRDAEFAEGLNLLSPKLKKEILSGKIKAKKSEIQQLSQIENPVEGIDSLDKIAELVSVNVKKEATQTKDHKFTVFPINDDSRENLLKKVQNGIKNASDTDVTVEIKGSFIIKNGLTEVWKKLRGFSDDIIINEDFTDRISIFQTVSLGIVQEL
jgi:predicted HTH domain antitoxin